MHELELNSSRFQLTNQKVKALDRAVSSKFENNNKKTYCFHTEKNAGIKESFAATVCS